MTNETVKKRRWFQVHLSTGIILMVVIGICIWINVNGTVTTYQYYINEEMSKSIGSSKNYSFGFPSTFLSVFSATGGRGAGRSEHDEDENQWSEAAL